MCDYLNSDMQAQYCDYRYMNMICELYELQALYDYMFFELLINRELYVRRRCFDTKIF